MLLAVFCVFSTVIFLPPLAATAQFDFVHLWHELNSRVDLVSDKLNIPGLPKIYPSRLAGLLMEQERHVTHQIYGITPDCYIYTFWATEAPVFLDKYRDGKDNKGKWKHLENLKCREKVIARVQTDRDSVPMTLLLVLDAYATRLRVQSAMNSHYTRENNILWTKLNPDVRAEWYFTQEIDPGYTIKKITVSEGNVLVVSADEFHARIFRLQIYKAYGEGSRIRPYLVRDSQLEVDARIVPPSFTNVLQLQSLYINFEERPYCPMEYLSDGQLPRLTKAVCNAAYTEYMNQKSCSPNCTKNSLEDWLDFHQHGCPLARSNAPPHHKYTGLIFEWGGEDTGVSVPLLTLRTNNLIGVNPGIKDIGYQIIGWDTAFRLKRGQDNIVSYARPLPKRKNKQINCTGIIDLGKILETRSALENVTSADEKKALLETLREKLSEEIVENKKKECSYGQLMKGVSSKKLLNGGYFHARMAHPLVRFEGTTMGFRVKGYNSRLMWSLLINFAVLSGAVALVHGIIWIRKHIRKFKEKRKKEKKRKEMEERIRIRMQIRKEQKEAKKEARKRSKMTAEKDGSNEMSKEQSRERSGEPSREPSSEMSKEPSKEKNREISKEKSKEANKQKGKKSKEKSKEKGKAKSKEKRNEKNTA